ncbi:MAG: DUF222 domain-containing protein [Acidimicrobiia bacterium]
MFADVVEELVGTPDAALDDRLRANELELRRLMAERAALVAVSEHRGVFTTHHRSMAGYLRATVNCSTNTANRDRKLGRLLVDHPCVGDTLAAGHISVDHALEIARFQNNPRIRDVLGPGVGAVIDVLVDLAEHSSHSDFAHEITGLIAKLDQDGAFADLRDAVDGRRGRVAEVGGEVVITATGGDPIQAAHMTAIFQAFCDAEYRADVEARRAQFGDDAALHPLPRTAAQRGFDALFSIFAAAYASPDGRRLPDLVTNLVVDDRSAHETLATAGIVLPSGDQLDLDDDGDIVDETALLTDLAHELADDPEAFLTRRCETANGTPVHTSVILRALLTGHVRRVVLDSRGVVIDYGTKQRLFTGLARQAAMLLTRTCEYPGCEHPATWSQIDHNTEWASGGRTDQDNSNVVCKFHNLDKHRQRWRTRRDPRGRAYTIRADGTIVLPVGERPPDLSIDEQTELARARLRDLTTTTAA